MDEIWKVIQNFPMYSVSNKGRIRNNKSGKIKKECYHNKGYPMVQLLDSRIRKASTKKIHRLVAIEFIPNPNNYPQINHVDGNKTNNNVENLEWCSNSYNNKHCRKLGLNPEFGENHHRAKLTEDSVRQIRKLYKEGVSTAKLSEMFGIAKPNIFHVWKRNSWKHVKD